jgi:DNA-binding transcriptional LysR family regulator
MLSIVPASLAMALTKGSDLIRRRLPYEAAAETVRAVWHTRDDHDFGHAWLRQMIATTAQTVESALG